MHWHLIALWFVYIFTLPVTIEGKLFQLNCCHSSNFCNLLTFAILQPLIGGGGEYHKVDVWRDARGLGWVTSHLRENRRAGLGCVSTIHKKNISHIVSL